MNKSGTILATTSDQGTLVRFFNTSTGEKIHEVRRGSKPATIQHLAFEIDENKYLTCCSNKQKIHIFKTAAIVDEKKQATTNTGNTHSYFSYLGMLGVPVAGDEWSFASLEVQSQTNNTICMVKDDCIRVASTDGKLHIATITAAGGNIQTKETLSLFDI